MAYRYRLVASIPFVLAACQSAVTRNVPAEAPAAPLAERSPEKGVPLQHAAEIMASWSAPSHASYRVDLLGVGKQRVSVRLANTSNRPVDVSPVSVAFAATREGVSFACDDHAGAVSTTHEPPTLAPGDSFVFERHLDCEMPLPGHYEIGMYVGLHGASSRSRGDYVGAFGFDVTADASSPIPFPGRPGLYVTLTGSPLTRPLPPEAWARGDYRVVLAFVNGSKQPVPLGPGRLAFLTYRRGSSLACSGQAEPIAMPEELGPGALHVVRAPVTCAPSEEGVYEIIGHFRFFGASDEIEVGRVSLRVVGSPFLYVPEPRGDCGSDCPREWLK